MRILSISILFLSIYFCFVLPDNIHNPDRSINLDKTLLATSPDTLVKMERTICFGTCPSYELTILENGNVTFVGKEFVAHEGMATGEMSQQNLDKLIQSIHESHFMEVASNPECESRYTDMPSVFLTIQLNGERNSVTHYQGCKGFQYEEELYDLEEAIDSLAGVKKWVEGE